MNAGELRDLLEALNLRQTEAARLLRIDPRTMRRYVLGECRVPGPVAAALETWARSGIPRGLEGRPDGWRFPAKLRERVKKLFVAG